MSRPNAGSKNKLAKLTEEDVQLILQLNDERLELLARLKNLTQKAIAKKFGVSPCRISEICGGVAWAHVAHKK